MLPTAASSTSTNPRRRAVDIGCDIHDYLETRDGEGSPWRKVGNVFPYPYYRADDKGTDEEFVDEFFFVRNYALFSVLADVRNGRGFAGVLTGSYINPLNGAPRGLPDDVTAEVRIQSDRWGLDGHSHSWCLLRELLDYDWAADHWEIGCLNREQYQDLQSGTLPTHWSSGISGRNVVTVDETTFKQYLLTGNLPRQVEGHYIPRETFAGGKVGPGMKVYVRASWKNPKGVADAVGTDIIDKIKELAETYDPDNTRHVFWFDN